MKRLLFIAIITVSIHSSLVKGQDVTTTSATDTTSTTATLNGTYEGDGSTYLVARFYYGTNRSNLDQYVVADPAFTNETQAATANITNLTSNTTYYFALKADVFPGDSYDTWSGDTLPFSTLAGEPSQVTDITFGTITDASIVVNWTGGDGANVIIVAKENGSINNKPDDGETYAADNVFKNGQDSLGTGEYVVFNGARTDGTVTVTGLTAGTNYYFRAFAYNNTGTNSDYNIDPGSGTNPDNTTTLQAEPTEQASIAAFSNIDKNSFTINWTGGNGTNTIVAVSISNAITPIPEDLETYTASSDFSTPGTQIQSSGYYTVYNGEGTSAPVSGLDANTTYYVAIFEYNGDAGSENYFPDIVSNTGSQITLKEAPTQQVSSFSFSSIALDQMTINWDGGNGDNVLVVAKAGSAITGAPSGTTIYSADPIFNNGQSVLGAGEYVVYNGAIDGDDASGITISNLGTGDTEYYYKAFAYNNSGADKEFIFSGSSYAQYTLDTEPSQASAVTFDNVTHEQMDISWTAQGDGSLVIVREASAVATEPIDASSYTANAAFGTTGTNFGSGYAVYNSTSNTVAVTGLNPQTTYHVEVFSYNNSPGVINYNSTGTGNTGSQATTAAPAPTQQVSNITFTPVSTTSLTIGWTNGNGDGRIVAMREADQGTITDPTDNTTYNASTTWGDLPANQDELGSSGYYIMYRGTGNSVTVTGLSAATTYWVQVFEYNNGAGQETYNVNTVTNNPLSGSTLKGEPGSDPTFVSTTNIKVDQMTVNFTAGDGDYRIIVASADAGTWTSPTDEQEYTANASFGSGQELGTGNYVVYSGSSSSVTVTDLPSPGTSYYFKAYEFNNTGNFTNYKSLGSDVGSGISGSGLSTWVGGDSGGATNWHIAENWSPSGIPDNTKDVSIPVTAANQPIISSNAFAANVNVEAGAYLTLSGGELDVTNEIILESPSGTGMSGAVIYNGGSLSAGTSTIERYFADVASHLFCSPIAGIEMTDIIGYAIGEYDEINSAFHYFITGDDISGFDELKGFEIRKAGASAPDMLSLSGTFLSGSYNHTLTNSAPGGVDPTESYGWNIVGNPYPSAIDLEGGLTLSSVDETVYVWTGSGYSSYNTNTGASADGGERYLAPMQGFFVHVTTGQTSGTFGTSTAIQAAGQTPTFKSPKENELQFIELQVNNETNSSYTNISFYEGATEAFDPMYDGYKLLAYNPKIPEIYTIIGESTISSINTYPLDALYNLTVDGLAFSVGIAKGNATSLTISLKESMNLPANIDVVLIDNQENTSVSLLDTSYTFSSITLNNDRFEVRFIPTRIAVEEINITSSLINDSISINDTTIFTTEIFPATASNQSVTWSVSDAIIGAIDSNTGLFSAKKNGVVSVKATANDGSGIVGTIEVTVHSTTILVSSIELKHNEVSNNIPINTLVQMEANVLPSNATNFTHIWSVDNQEIATINALTGLLNTKAEGTVIVTATANDDSGTTGSIELSLYTPEVLANSISIYHNNENNSFLQNETLQLYTNIAPENTSVQTIEWKSENNNIATVSSNGLVSGKNEGSTIITATCKDGSGISDTITINVVNAITLVSSISITTEGSESSVEVNSQLQLIANVLPEDASNSTVTWSVDDSNIATINSTGLLTGKSSGIVNVSAVANDESSIGTSLQITVVNFTDIEQNANKIAVYYPNPTKGELIIESELKNCQYSIYDNIGRKLFAGEFSYSEKINLTPLNNGIYYIEFINEANRQIEKIIKE